MMNRIRSVEILFLAAALLGVVCIIGLTWKGGTDSAPREAQRSKDLSVVGRGVSAYGEKYRLASELLESGQISEAEAIYKTLIKFEPNSPYPYLGLAACRGELDDHEGALEFYDKAFEMDPKSPYALVGMGSCYISMSDYAKAVEKYSASLGLDAEMPQAHWGLTVASARLGRQARARRHLKQFRKLAPDSPEIKYLEAVIKEPAAQPATRPSAPATQPGA